MYNINEPMDQLKWLYKRSTVEKWDSDFARGKNISLK